MLMLGLARNSLRSGAGRRGTLLLGILSIGLLITAIFPPARRGEQSTSGEIHSMTFLVNVLCTLLAPKGTPARVAPEAIKLRALARE
jgi:hypothetical protein